MLWPHYCPCYGISKGITLLAAGLFGLIHFVLSQNKINIICLIESWNKLFILNTLCDLKTTFVLGYAGALHSSGLFWRYIGIPYRARVKQGATEVPAPGPQMKIVFFHSCCMFNIQYIRTCGIHTCILLSLLLGYTGYSFSSYSTTPV